MKSFLKMRNGSKLIIETDWIEVTRGGTLGGPVDVVRQFIPGMTTFTLIRDGRSIPLSAGQARAMAGGQGRHHFE